MSEIPELDQLIEESENIRRNKKYRQEDRFFKFSMFLLMFSFPLMFFSFLIFGINIGSGVLATYMFLICSLFFYRAMCDLTKEFLKDDWEGVDMTKRYHRK